MNMIIIHYVHYENVKMKLIVYNFYMLIKTHKVNPQLSIAIILLLFMD